MKKLKYKESSEDSGAPIEDDNFCLECGEPNYKASKVPGLCAECILPPTR